MKNQIYSEKKKVKSGHEDELKPIILLIDDDNGDINDICSNIDGYSIYPVDVNEFGSYAKIADFVKDFIKNNLEQVKCIICDLKFDGFQFDGYDVIEAIRNRLSIKKYPFYQQLIPIIAYTQYTDAIMKARALEVGATVALQKTHTRYLRAVINKQIEDFTLICKEFVLAKFYKVGISFSGKDTRDFVKKVSDFLAMKYSKSKVFFDEYHLPEVQSTNAENGLKSIYCEKCEYVVPVFSTNYLSEEWSGKVEWKSIKKSFLPLHEEKIIPLLVLNNDNIDIDKELKRYGFNNKAIVITVPNKERLTKKDAEKASQQIINKIQYLEERSAKEY